MNSSLSSQSLIGATIEEKIRLGLLSVAIVDALGAPAEFKTRGAFDPVVSMRKAENKYYKLPEPGIWTDDTSMALCLAHSLANSGGPEGTDGEGGFDEAHQLDTYVAWYSKGTLSCTEECFDIGTTTRAALDTWKGSRSVGLEKIQRNLKGEHYRGNGSLMRVLPIGLAYWSLGEKKAAEFARRSSITTHPNSMCQEACKVYTRLIVTIMAHTSSAEPLTKLDLLHQLSQDAVLDPSLKEKICIPPPPADCQSIEEYYTTTHPLLQIATRFPPSKLDANGIPTIPPVDALSSSGYVLTTLVAALYAFFATDSFSAGALLVVNLGDDADTVGAVYGGLAGVWYASQGEESDWYKGVTNKGWLGDLKRQDIVEKIADGLINYERKVRSS